MYYRKNHRCNASHSLCIFDNRLQPDNEDRNVNEHWDCILALRF